MKRGLPFGGFVLAAALMLIAAQATSAIDFESFEFNDPAGTNLAGAANTGNPGNHWFEAGNMDKSDIRSGSYHVVKNTTGLASNYLQVSNVTSGTRYLVARMSGWNFYDDGGPLEEVRFAFLNDDTGTSGATITAQATIRRDADRNIVLVGTALGTGSADIPGSHLLNVPDQFGDSLQTSPFTLVLELNKDANSYKVFYKDGSNPTQVLGLGSVAPSRGGNSIRLAVNNNVGAFNDDYPLQPAYEYFSIDRMALSDTNPLADLISLEIDRTTASMTLRNTSGSTISGIQSYSITSASGALNPAGWNTSGATPTVSTNEELAASFSAPVSLTNGQTLTLSTGAGAWLKSPFEDLQMVLNLSSGQNRTVNVNFLGNGGVKWMTGDFDFNNAIDTGDWLHFIANAETDIAGLSRVARYLRGDLTDDGRNSIADFVQFKAIYDAANGAGSFEAMLAGLSVPEPNSIVLLGAAMLLWTCQPRRRSSAGNVAGHRLHIHASVDCLLGVPAMPRVRRLFSLMIIAAMMAVATPHAHAVILEDFPFNDDNGTLLDEAANMANPSNTWILGGASWSPSAVDNGAFRITKSSGTLATAHIDIANITTGKAWLVMEVAGWNYTATPSATSEEVRLAFLDNEGTSGSTITAQMQINRSGSGLTLLGNALPAGSATNISGSYALPLARTDPFTMVLELDKDLDQYSVYYKDGDAPFATLGTGNVGVSTLHSGNRQGNSVRFAATGQFSDVGEFFDVNRIYLTDESPIIGPVTPTVLTLEVRSNGQVAIRNDTNVAIVINSYRIESSTADLNFAGWNSLSDQNLDATGSGVGQSWDEAGGASDSVLAESFLLGSSTIAPGGAPLSLGSAFKPGGDHEQLVFQYHDINTGVIVTGEVDFISVVGLEGDYNSDGKVDAADYVLWRKNGINGQQGYNTWRANFGVTAGGAGGLAATSVPEPATLLQVLLVLLLINLVHTRCNGTLLVGCLPIRSDGRAGRQSLAKVQEPHLPVR